MVRSFVAGFLAVVLVGMGAPAHAATSVTLPAHTSDSSDDVRVFGATPAGFVVDQGEWPSGRVLVGPAGSTLSVLGTPGWEALGASGNYAWYRENGRAYRVDLRTKVTTSYPTSGGWLAWTPDGWLSSDGSSISRTVAGGATTTLVSGIDTSANLVEAAADGTGAVLLYDQVTNGVRDRYVSLATWGQAGVQTVWRQSEGAVYALQLMDVALTSSTISFTTDTTLGGNAYFVHTRPRAGGTITTTGIPADVDAYGLTAVGSAVALTARYTYGVDPSRVAVLNGGSWHYVTLPGAAAALVSSTGTAFAIGVSGKNTVAGVYTFGVTGGATRVATLPAPTALPRNAILSAGQLFYADDAVAVPYRGGSLWRRPVSGSADVRVGAETRLAAPVSLGNGGYDDAEAAFSAGRGLIRNPTVAREFQLLSRGVATRTLPLADTDTYQLSGPYAAIGAKIYRADGTLVLDLSAENNGKLALFGSTLIYQSGTSKILLRDLTKPTVAPATLASSGICDQNGNCGYGIAAWYDKVAWQRADETVAVRTLSTGATRIVDPGVLTPVQLSDNALSWTDSGNTKAVDLGSSTSAPVTLTGLRNSTLDGHLAAGINEDGRVVVRTLPFGSTRKTPVRLIGTLAPAAFTPGTTGTWVPQFDLTKPATGVTLTIRSGTTVVRTLTGTAPDGSIRDLVWDGKNTAGARVAAGACTYQLTATAADGEGALAPAVTGTVTVR